MIPLPMPIDPPISAIASMQSTRLELRNLLGSPHYVETDPRRTCGGEQDGWAYMLETGQRILVIFDVPSGYAELFGDPPDLSSVLEALKISSDGPRVVPHSEPVAFG